MVIHSDILWYRISWSTLFLVVIYPLLSTKRPPEPKILIEEIVSKIVIYEIPTICPEARG